MYSVKQFALGLLILAPMTALAGVPTQPQDAQSCQAQPMYDFYCPDGTGSYVHYMDNGCSITCNAGQSATCAQAACDPDQTGQETPSSCTCN